MNAPEPEPAELAAQRVDVAMMAFAEPFTALARARFLVGVAPFHAGETSKSAYAVCAGCAKKHCEVLADALGTVIQFAKRHLSELFKV